MKTASDADGQHQHIEHHVSSAFEDLPNELIIRIFELVGVGLHDVINELPVERSPSKSLLRLALCSSRFHALAEPWMYNYVSIVDEKKSLLSFVFRILARPDLARRVRRLYLYTYFDTYLDREELYGAIDMSSITDTERARVLAAVRTASISDSEAEKLTKAVEAGMWDAFAALTLLLISNVERLQFDNWPSHNGHCPSIVGLFECAATLQDHDEASAFSMNNLSQISVRYWDTKYGFPVDVLVPFLRLKSVTIFHAHMIEQDGAERPPWMDPPPTFTVKDLFLDHANITHDFMVPFFQCFKNLERLYYHYSFGCFNVGDEPPRMIEALNHLKHSLREITIVSDYMGEGAFGGIAEAESIGSFADRNYVS